MKARLATALHGGIGRDGNGRSIGWRSTVSTRPSPWLGKMPFGSTSSSLTLYGQGRHYPTVTVTVTVCICICVVAIHGNCNRNGYLV